MRATGSTSAKRGPDDPADGLHPVFHAGERPLPASGPCSPPPPRKEDPLWEGSKYMATALPNFLLFSWLLGGMWF